MNLTSLDESKYNRPPIPIGTAIHKHQNANLLNILWKLAPGIDSTTTSLNI
jgi:hypothetical protein